MRKLKNMTQSLESTGARSRGQTLWQLCLSSGKDRFLRKWSGLIIDPMCAEMCLTVTLIQRASSWPQRRGTRVRSTCTGRCTCLTSAWGTWSPSWPPTGPRSRWSSCTKTPGRSTRRRGWRKTPGSLGPGCASRWCGTWRGWRSSQHTPGTTLRKKFNSLTAFTLILLGTPSLCSVRRCSSCSVRRCWRISYSFWKLHHQLRSNCPKRDFKTFLFNIMHGRRTQLLTRAWEELMKSVRVCMNSVYTHLWNK